MKTYKEFILEARDKKDKNPTDTSNNIPPNEQEMLARDLRDNPTQTTAKRILDAFHKANQTEVEKHPIKWHPANKLFNFPKRKK